MSTYGSSFLDKALKTARDGYPVFPLRQGMKTPIYDGGFKLATRDEAQIREWWTENPYANIGIPTGPASGLAILDVDPDNGGNESCKALFLDHGGQPDTPILRTPSGGIHLYFKHTEGLRNSASKIGDGLDIRGDGGYVVANGSVAEGKEYSWVVPSTSGPFAPFPNWLYEIAVKPEPPKSLTTSDGFVQEGSRNTYLVKLAGTLRRAEFSVEIIKDALLAQNERVCVPPLPDEEVYRIANQAEGWAQGEIEKDANPIESAYKRMNFLRPSDWLHEPIEEDTWLVDGLVPSGSLVMTVSFPKGGKSTFTRHLGVAVSKGETFLGRKVRQGKVLYLAVEEFHKKVKQAFKRLGLTSDDDLLLKFDKPDRHAVDDLRLICEQEKPVLVIIDTVTRMPKKSFELNDYFANSEWLDPYMYLAHDLNIVVMVNYHSSRNGRKLEGIEAIASPLGSTGILATPDQFINIMTEPDNSRSISTVGRYEPVPPTLLAFDKETQRLSVVGEKSEVEKQQLRVSIVEALTDEWGKQRDILEGIQGNATKKLEALNELVSEERVKRQGEGRKNSPYEIRKTFLFSVPTLEGEQETESNEVQQPPDGKLSWVQ